MSVFAITMTNGTRTASASLAYTVENAGTLTLGYDTPRFFPLGAGIPTQLPRLGAATPGLATTYALRAGALPDGLLLGGDGSIAGTPAATGTFGFTIQAVNGDRQATAPVTYTIEHAGALALGYPTPQTFDAGLPIPGQAPVLGNPTPGLGTSFALTAGTLPPGLVLDANGVIAGTPDTPGTYAFTITASNGSRAATADLTYIIPAG